MIDRFQSLADRVNLPLDALGNPIPILAFGTTVFVAINATTSETALPAGTDLIYLSTSIDAYINFGVSPVTAARDGANPLVLAGEGPLRVPLLTTFIATISRDAAETGQAAVATLITR